MKTYNANITCSIANNKEGVPTCKVKYAVPFDTFLDLPVADMQRDPELMDKAVTACGNTLYDNFFRLQSVELLDEIRPQLDEKGQSMLDQFIDENRVKFEQQLVHA